MNQHALFSLFQRNQAQNRKFNMKALAREIGVHYSVFYLWMKGKRNMKYANYQRFLEATNITEEQVAEEAERLNI